MSQTARQPAKIAAAAPRAAREPARDRAALDDQKRSFLRMVSHELRTPLNAIIGFSEILSTELYGPLGAPAYKEYADLVHQSGHRLLRLVNQVLEIARLEGDVVDLKIGPEALEPALEDVMGALAAEQTARGVRIETPGTHRMPEVFADSRGLRTVLTNLLHNAVSFSPPGSRVSVTARRLDGVVEICVADQGPGVEAEDIPRLLKPFQQGGATLTRASEGAGLGLPIAQLMCQAMGGDLRLKSAPGQGLTALITLPAA